MALKRFIEAYTVLLGLCILGLLTILLPLAIIAALGLSTNQVVMYLVFLALWIAMLYVWAKAIKLVRRYYTRKLASDEELGRT